MEQEFDALPYALMLKIFAFCDWDDRLRLSVVNSRWRSALLNTRNLDHYQLVLESESQCTQLSKNLQSSVPHVRFQRQLTRYRRRDYSYEELCTLLGNTLGSFSSLYSLDLSEFHSEEDVKNEQLRQLLNPACDVLARLKELKVRNRLSCLLSTCVGLQRLRISGSLHLDVDQLVSSYFEQLSGELKVLEIPRTVFTDFQLLAHFTNRGVPLDTLDLGSEVYHSNVLAAGRNRKDGGFYIGDLAELRANHVTRQLVFSVLIDLESADDWSQSLSALSQLRQFCKIKLNIVGSTCRVDLPFVLKHIPFDCVTSLQVNLPSASFDHLATFLPSKLENLTQLEVTFHDDESSAFFKLICAASNLRKLKLIGAHDQLNQPTSVFCLDFISRNCRHLRSLSLSRVDCGNLKEMKSFGCPISLAQLQSLELDSATSVRWYRLLTPNLRKLRISIYDSRQSADDFMEFWKHASLSSRLTHVNVSMYFEDEEFFNWLGSLQSLRWLRSLTLSCSIRRPLRKSSPYLNQLIEALRKCRSLRHMKFWLTFAERAALDQIAAALPHLELSDPGV